MIFRLLLAILIATASFAASAITTPQTVAAYSRSYNCITYSDNDGTPGFEEQLRGTCTQEQISAEVVQAERDYNSSQGKKNCSKQKDEGAVWLEFTGTCVTAEEGFPLIISYILTFASIIAGIVFITASYKYMTSRGNPAALAESRDMLLSAVIGLVIIALAYVVVGVLNGAFEGVGNINLNPFLPQ